MQLLVCRSCANSPTGFFSINLAMCSCLQHLRWRALFLASSCSILSLRSFSREFRCMIASSRDLGCWAKYLVCPKGIFLLYKVFFYGSRLSILFWDTFPVAKVVTGCLPCPKIFNSLAVSTTNIEPIHVSWKVEYSGSTGITTRFGTVINSDFIIGGEIFFVCIFLVASVIESNIWW